MWSDAGRVTTQSSRYWHLLESPHSSHATELSASASASGSGGVLDQGRAEADEQQLPDAGTRVLASMLGKVEVRHSLVAAGTSCFLL